MDSAARVQIVETVRLSFPDTEALYLYGSAAAGTLGPNSDVDLGLLLPHVRAREEGSLVLHDLRFDLEKLLNRDVDLVNLRRSPIVLQKEVLATGVLLYETDPATTAGYEMLVLSLYGKLNEERADILAAFAADKRAYKL